MQRINGFTLEIEPILVSAKVIESVHENEEFDNDKIKEYLK